MLNKQKLSIYTFVVVAISIFLIGFVGMSVSLNYIEQQYIQLQLDVNRRRAESMARMIEYEIQRGLSQDSIIQKMQAAIQGTDTEKGFLCMFNEKGAELVCHPNPDMVGMPVSENFRFDDFSAKKQRVATEVISSSVATGGLLHKKNNAIDIVYMTPVRGTDWMMSAHENIALIQSEIALHRRIFTIGSIAMGLLIAFVATLVARTIGGRYERKIEEQNEMLDIKLNETKELNEEITQQKNEIETQRDYLEEQRDEIAIANKEITASIVYAQRIQQAILPEKEFIASIFPEHFIFFKPRDIVSGDFYWFSKKGGLAFAIAADCTGHGVPGAFMSMLGVTFLNEIVNEKNIIQPNEILNHLRQRIIHTLQQTGKADEAKDGMDMALCRINTRSLQMQYAGAYNPVYIVRNNQLTELKPDKIPVSIHQQHTNKPFTTQAFQLQAGDMVYLFSDGFPDQFGGPRGRKFLSKRLKQMLLKVSSLPASQQKEAIGQQLQQWQGDEFQVDDILLTGLKISFA